MSFTLLLLLFSCSTKVLIVSSPIGAEVTYNDSFVGTTPAEIQVWHIPFSNPVVEISLPRYRTTNITLKKDKKPISRFWELITFRWKKGLGLTPSEEHEIFLVPKHKTAGSWTSEDVP